MAIKQFWSFQGMDSNIDLINNGWYAITNTMGFSTDTPTPYGRAIAPNDWQAFLIPDAWNTTLISAFHYKTPSSLGSTLPIWYVGTGMLNSRLSLSLTIERKLQLSSELGGVLGVHDTPLALGTYYHLQLKHKLYSDGTAFIQVKLNGSTIFNFTGANCNTGGAAINIVSIYGISSVRYANIAIADTTGTLNNDWLGELIARPLLLNGDVSNDFTLSTGSIAYQLLDEYIGSENEADYIESSTPGHRAVFAFEDISDASSIAALKLHAKAGKDDAGAIGLKLGLKHSTDEQQKTLTLPVGQGDFNEFFETYDGTNALTQTTLNASNITLEVTS